MESRRVSFDNAETFLAHIKMHMVALVVLDIWMERITGLEVLTATLRDFATNARPLSLPLATISRPAPRRCKPPAGLFY